MKPTLACDLDFTKVRYPVMVFAKIDGVRGLNVEAKFVGRSGKAFKNKLNTEFFSNPLFDGLDGEMVVDKVTGDGICNATTSALSTINGTIPTRWCLFDFVIDGVNNLKPYVQRYASMHSIVADLINEHPELLGRLWVIPFVMAYCKEDVERLEMEALEQGYEGLILRDPEGVYKYGRCTAKEANYLRLKRFVEAEIVVTRVSEGQHNGNVKTRDPNGYAERSTHAENMHPNGMIGTIHGQALKTEHHGNKIVITEGAEIEVAPGKMTHEQRKYLFENQEEILGKIAKYKFFPIGVKDKPRFPTFQCFRDPNDM